MLKQLYIKNYALFAETEISFPAGLNVLTGETGAGKSLLVGALGLIMGKRADNSVIFYSEEKCVVEAEFAELDISIMATLSKQDAFDLEGHGLIIRREIRPNGKSRAFINDTPVSLQLLKEVSTHLLDLHGQHENQSLLQADRQLSLLDAYANCGHKVLEFGGKLRVCQQLQTQIKQLEKKEQQSREQLEYLNFQLSELQAANLQEGEEESLEQEFNILQHSEDIKETLGFSVDQLYEQDLSIYSQLSEVLVSLGKVSQLSSNLHVEGERLRESQDLIKDVSFSLKNILDNIESDQERLSFIEERLAVYHKLKLKYGVNSSAELIATFTNLERQLADFHSLEDQIAELKTNFQMELSALAELGLQIEKVRLKAKKSLEKQIVDLLNQVGFTKARFEIALERNLHPEGFLSIEGEDIKPTSSGINKVFFLIQTNPGLPAGPLHQIASGGEISRVMLAIKAVLADKFAFPVLIFDEIDSGISGEIANKVGLVMQKLAAQFQILSITHLPQIAAKGNNHFEIYKEVKGGNTYSSIRRLHTEDRVHTIATMLSGDQPSEGAIRNAKELMG